MIRSTSYELTDGVLEACGLGDRLTADRGCRAPDGCATSIHYSLSLFSLFPSISHSRFSPWKSADPFPLSLSPSIVSV